MTRAGFGSAALLCGVEAVEAWHLDVEQRYLDVEVAGGGDGFVAGRGLGDDRDATGGFEDGAEPGADEGLVVGDEHPERKAHAEAVGRVTWMRWRPSSVGPASRVPPSALTRSRMPASPCPPGSRRRTGRPSSMTLTLTFPGV